MVSRRLATVFSALLLASTGIAYAQVGKHTMEAALDADFKAEDQRAWIERLASASNFVGSAHNGANAEFLLAHFRKWGWDARIESFDVLYPTPLATHLELITPERHAPELRAKAMLYNNTESNSRDGFDAGGSESYQRLANAVATDVRDPQAGTSTAVRRSTVVRAGAYDRREQPLAS